MSLTKIHIVAFLLVLGRCNAETTENHGEIKVNDSDDIEYSAIDDAVEDLVDFTKTHEDANEEENSTEDDLPILPPIILLDFDNGTASDNETAEEKSKRTVNNALGYGFNQNNLLPGKYNYYFPAGKSGTVVSIEESISPFLPKTIIEKVQPGNQKPVSGSFTNVRQQSQYGSAQGTSAQSFSSHSNYQYYDPAAKSQPVFGLRTKLTRTSNSEPFRGFFQSARPTIETPYSNVNYRNGAFSSTTPQPLMYGPTERTNYITPSPQSYTGLGSSRYTYVTSSPPPYATGMYTQRYLDQNTRQSINVQGYSRPGQSVTSTPSPIDGFVGSAGVPTRINPHGYVRPGSNTLRSSTPGPDDVSAYEETAGPFADLPKYTVENGIRYENKIFWRYPDGRVTDVPPMEYETYSYPSLAALRTTQGPSPIYESTSQQSNAVAQGPVQFPVVQEPNERPSPFISAESLSSSVSQQQLYRLGYQNLLSQKQIVPQQTKSGSVVSSTVYPVSSTSPTTPRNSVFRAGNKGQKQRYETTLRPPVSKYIVNSPNPEYTTSSYTTESVPRRTTPTNFFASSASRNSVKKTGAGNKNLGNYSNLQYSDLLNYNPSISQYIKNPASILNVQPTFVQAGNSLIPVIILRVDGLPPIQPKASPNVNLKALLQQYLIQYANNLEQLTQSSNYNLGNEQPAREQNPFSASNLRELARLAQHDSQDSIGNPTDTYVGKSSYDTSNLNVEKYRQGGKYGERMAPRPKVKSVQIIENPAIPNFRAKN